MRPARARPVRLRELQEARELQIQIQLADIRGVCATQPPHAGGLDPGYQHNRYVDRRMLARIRGWLVGELVAVAEAKAAGTVALTHL